MSEPKHASKTQALVAFATANPDLTVWCFSEQRAEELIAFGVPRRQVRWGMPSNGSRVEFLETRL